MAGPWKHHLKGPKPLSRTDSTHSRYVQMLLEQDDMPAMHNMLASFVWLLLAGFLVFLGTFTSIQHSIADKAAGPLGGKPAEDIKSVKNMPLLVLAAITCGIAVLGIASLVLRHAHNYVWLSNRIFVPGMANCLTGLLSTLVGVYTQQHGAWSITAKLTAIVEGSGLGVSEILFLATDRFLLRRVKQSHDAHYDTWPSDRSLDKW